MPKVILFREESKDHRDNNFIKEATEANLNFIEVDIHNSIILPGKIIAPDLGEVNFEDGDFIWSTSNDEMIHNSIISGLPGDKDILAWPKPDAIKFVDKFYTAAFYKKHNIPTPKTVLVNTIHINPEIVEQVGGFPCVIKKTQGSHGRDVGIVNSIEEIRHFINDSITQHYNQDKNYRKKQLFILQEFIKESSGSDFRVLCINGRVLGAIQRISQTDDFRANVSLGGEVQEFKVDQELEDLSLKIMEKGNLFYGGLDFIKGNKGYLAIEINTCAQFSGFKKATGMNVAKEIVKEITNVQQAQNHN